MYNFITKLKKKKKKALGKNSAGSDQLLVEKLDLL